MRDSQDICFMSNLSFTLLIVQMNSLQAIMGYFIQYVVYTYIYIYIYIYTVYGTSF
jgi:hypothetical protein